MLRQKMENSSEVAIKKRNKKMTDNKLAQEFASGGAKVIALDNSESVHKYSGADKEVLNNIFDRELSPMQNYAENVASQSKAFMQAIDRGFNDALEVNKPTNFVELSAASKAKIVKMEPLAQAVTRKNVANGR